MFGNGNQVRITAHWRVERIDTLEIPEHVGPDVLDDLAVGRAKVGLGSAEDRIKVLTTARILLQRGATGAEVRGQCPCATSTMILMQDSNKLV